MTAAPVRILYVSTPRYDFTTATLIEGLNALPGIELRTTAAGNYADPTQVLNREDAVAYGRRADVILLAYARGVASSIFWSIDDKGPVRVFVDGGDNSELTIAIEQLPRFDVVFKREFFLNDNSVRNLLKLVFRVRPGIWGTVRRHPVVPFPSFVAWKNVTRPKDFVRNLAAVPATSRFHPFPYGIEERFQGTLNTRPRFELSCILSCHVPERKEFVARLESLRLPNTFVGEIPIQPEHTDRLIALGAVKPESRRAVELGHNPDYYARINDSRRSISIPGGGFDTLRFWEILASGSLLVSKRIAIEMPHPPVEGKHYLAFDSFAELRDALEKSYHRPDEADEVRAAGHEFSLRFHTTRARALYLLSTLVERRLLASDRLPALADSRSAEASRSTHAIAFNLR
jgi:hypothetical protein